MFGVGVPGRVWHRGMCSTLRAVVARAVYFRAGCVFYYVELSSFNLPLIFWVFYCASRLPASLLLEMRLVSGRFGDGVWSRTTSDKKREEEQSVMGFAENYPPLLFGLAKDGEWMRCVAASRHHSLTEDRTWKAGVDGGGLRYRLVAE